MQWHWEIGGLVALVIIIYILGKIEERLGALVRIELARERRYEENRPPHEWEC